MMLKRKSKFLFLILTGLVLCPQIVEAKDKKKNLMYDGKSVTEWVGKLIYSKIDGKKKAMTAIKAIGEPAVPYLIKNLGKRDAFYWVAAALGELGEKSVPAIPKLISHLSDKYDRNADKAYEVIRQIGPKSVPYLVKALSKEKKFAPKLKLVKLLGTFGAQSKDAVPAIAKLLRNKNPDMRKAASLSLGNMGPTAAKAAAKELSNKKSYVRLAAAASLARMGASAKEVVPLLEARLLKEKKKDVKEAIKNAILNIKA
ncbi:MAG: HEAT repeat domain-containing protein [Planctomycetota bacterium]|nr:HEAT repeat domain-containing protein [Planctomycetota bacterium]